MLLLEKGVLGKCLLMVHFRKLEKLGLRLLKYSLIRKRVLAQELRIGGTMRSV
jgi:hypothetical protein